MVIYCKVRYVKLNTFLLKDVLQYQRKQTRFRSAIARAPHSRGPPNPNPNARPREWRTPGMGGRYQQTVWSVVWLTQCATAPHKW